MSSLKQSILQTLAYAECFDYPLTSSMVYRYLISSKSYTKADVNRVLAKLVISKKIIKEKTLYCFPNKRHLFKRHYQNKLTSTRKILIAKKQTTILAALPWIEGIWITGNVAMHNAQENDDIDLLLVVRESHVWITRLIVLFIYGTTGNLRLRSDKSHQVKNKLCINMYIDMDALMIPPHNRNLYSAHEVLQVMPLVNKHATYQKFLSENSWISSYLANNEFQHSNTQAQESISRSSSIARLCNKFLFRVQYAYMKKHMSREFVDEHRAFFHPRNTTEIVISQYKQNCLDQGVVIKP